MKTFLHNFDEWKIIKESEIYERQYSDAEREHLAKEGKALPDGSYPINSKNDLKNAIKAYGRAKDPEVAKQHIKKRAKEMDLLGLIPDEWK